MMHPRHFAIERDPDHEQGYLVKDSHGTVVAKCTAGGTGACWNIDFEPDDEESVPVHVCELDEAIEMLIALRDSQVHADNRARWE